MAGSNRRRFKVSAPVSAVKLVEHPGSTLRSPTQIMLQIPVDAVVEVEGRASRSGLVNVIWNGDAFSVFHEDFEKSALPLDLQ